MKIEVLNKSANLLILKPKRFTIIVNRLGIIQYFLRLKLELFQPHPHIKHRIKKDYPSHGCYTMITHYFTVEL